MDNSFIPSIGHLCVSSFTPDMILNAVGFYLVSYPLTIFLIRMFRFVGCLNYKRLFIRNPILSRLAERTQGTSDTDLLYMKTKIGA